MKKVVIQGVKGSFHDIAARSYFQEPVQLVEADSFSSLFDMFSMNQKIDHAVMAIENTIAGSIMHNYSLLQKSNFHITGEILLKIKQNLLVLPGTTPEDIREVHSHPMALLQCKDFLSTFKEWKKVETVDTALSAEKIVKTESKHVAAIASELAAQEYGLEILNGGIETNKRNFTRFLILSRKSDDVFQDNCEKASMCFSLKHKTGSLNQILNILANRSCNLTKIQSVPIVGKEWQYFFFVDFILEKNAFSSIVEDMDREVESLHILGHYNKGKYHDS